MPSKLLKGQSRNKSKQETVECPTCKEEIPHGKVHCNGSAIAVGCAASGPHHGSQLWRDCWKCGKSMGCTSCVSGAYRKDYQGEWLNATLVCKRCRVKTTIESLLNGGPISRFSLHFDFADHRIAYNEAQDVPGMSAYPQRWQAALGQQDANGGYSGEHDEHAAFMLLLKMLRMAIGFKQYRTTRPARNEQVERLTEAV